MPLEMLAECLSFWLTVQVCPNGAAALNQRRHAKSHRAVSRRMAKYSVLRIGSLDMSHHQTKNTELNHCVSSDLAKKASTGTIMP
jgi:hypothetical protein